MQRKNTNKTTTKTTPKTSRVKKVAKTKESQPQPMEVLPETKNKKISPPIIILLLSVFILGFLAYAFKDKFLAAVVNGKPVFRYELNKRLTDSFGKETLENLIVEKLIEEEAEKEEILITKEEIDVEVEKLAKSLGEETKIEEVLAFQGISLEDFRNQLKLRLQVNKIMEKDVNISEEEIETFIKDNGSVLIATDEAEKRVEAENALKDQKIGEKIQVWVSDLLAKAKITRYLK